MYLYLCICIYIHHKIDASRGADGDEVVRECITAMNANHHLETVKKTIKGALQLLINRYG